MSLPAVRWAASPHDGRCHALTVEQADAAVSRGWADALCGLTLPGVGLQPSDEPHGGGLCMPCVVEVTSDLPDPGRFGTL